MTNGIVGTILPCILTWEAEAIGGRWQNGDCVVHKIDVAACPLSIILDELVVEVTSGNIIGAVLIVAYKENSNKRS